MKNSLVSAYFMLINKGKKKLPSEKELVTFAFHLGRAANEVKKGIKELKKGEKHDTSTTITKIKIE